MFRFWAGKSKGTRLRDGEDRFSVSAGMIYVGRSRASRSEVPQLLKTPVADVVRFELVVVVNPYDVDECFFVAIPAH